MSDYKISHPFVHGFPTGLSNGLLAGVVAGGLILLILITCLSAHQTQLVMVKRWLCTCFHDRCL